MAEDALEKLKVKYGSVLNKVKELGVRLDNVHVQDGKLVLRGHGKTKADTDQIWNQIKLTDPAFADLSAQFTYDSAAAAAPAAPAAARTYTVEKGDTLSAIAQKLLGKASDYPRIFEANRDQLSDPDKIRPGQVLKIPG